MGDNTLLTSVNELVSGYGVAGAIVAALAAIICIGLGLSLLGQLIRRYSQWRRRPGAEANPTAFIIRLTLVPLAMLGIGLVLATAAIIGLEPYLQWIVSTALVMVIGGGVGAAELVSRYKDRPERAVRTTPAIFYISLNALASVAALYLIYVWREKLFTIKPTADWPPDAGTLVQAVLLAGFSSLLFFRTNLFKLRVGDSDLAVGPSIVLDSLLAASDRAVDRVMAEPRADFVHRVMKEVSFEKAAVILPGHCLALMQNISSAESQRIAGVVNQLRADKEMPDKIKSLNLGLAILTVVGERVLETAVKFLESDIQDTTTRLVQDVADVMKDVSFEGARRMLPSYCIALWPKPIAAEAQEKVKTDTATLAALKGVPEKYKAILLGIWLARLTDGATLRKAVVDLGVSIRVDGSRPDADGTSSAPVPDGAKRGDAEPAGAKLSDATPSGATSADAKPADVNSGAVAAADASAVVARPADEHPKT